MALPVKTQLKYWGIAAAVFALLLWLLDSALVPFLLAGVVAYLLDPVADRLERAGLSRMAATGVITVVAALVMTLVAMLVIPVVVQQVVKLVQTAPSLVKNAAAVLTERFPSLSQEGSTLNTSLHTLADSIQSQQGSLLDPVVSSAMSLVDIISLVVIVPVVSVYLLLDWDQMVARVDELLPRSHAPTIRRLFKEIDQTLAAFVRGMGVVCAILGAYYAIALMLIGLQFGLVIGLVAGLVTFIPYLGAVIGGSLAVGLALFQFWGDWLMVGGVAIIFVVGQVIEGNFLTPKIVGDSVGLHPVWLLLALSIFGKLFGFVGLLIAVPLGAAIGVLVRFLVSDVYKSSLLYRGEAAPDSTSEAMDSAPAPVEDSEPSDA